ncbi:MAG: SagB/ThcOx family dehydrogenase [Verrucomicrobiota bacterium]
MKSYRLGLTLPLALCSLLLCSCGQPEPETETIRELNELPIEQLRLFLKGYPGDWRSDQAQLQAGPEPLDEKPAAPEAIRIPLPSPEAQKNSALSLAAAIANRRSVREFSDASLSLEELSFLLWATQGVTGVQHDDAGKVVKRYRAAPSGGARYPLETYLVIHRVEDVPAGLYRYLPSTHELVCVREDNALLEPFQQACFGMPTVGDSAVLFIWAAVPYRTEWKYGYISHRMIAMEAGHVCQNLYLAVTSSGLGCCAILSYHQPTIDQLIGIDGEDEFAIYMACVGKLKSN